MEPTIEEIVKSFHEYVKTLPLQETHIYVIDKYIPDFLTSSLKKYGDARYQEGRDDAISYVMQHLEPDGRPHNWITASEAVLEAAREGKEV